MSHWQFDKKGGSLIFNTLKPNLPIMRFNNYIVGNRQPLPGSNTHFFSCKKRLEYSFLHLLWYPTAIIRDRNYHTIIGRIMLS